jgi:hypothetical protein
MRSHKPNINFGKIVHRNTKTINVFTSKDSCGAFLSLFAALYTFHKATPPALKKLKRIKDMNKDACIIPMFGIQQQLFIPTLISPIKRARVLNMIPLRSGIIYKTSEIINKKVESFRRKKEIDTLRRKLQKWSLNLYCDYTPMGMFNQDIAILKWFSSHGKNIDFRYLIFLEHDIFLTKPISDIYRKYTCYDAGFVNYRIASPSWVWYRKFKVREFLKKWLSKQGLKTNIYACLFVGNMVSREVLEELEKIPYPHYGFCEMRWPTIITALGFKCVKLDLPMVRYKPPYKKSEILAHKELGIFHPVVEDIIL